ncbi:MAG: PQQ-binding-like beta-propeller repeat protein [Planctomycetes bacterium]|nr:PQQ-binding-like beta-propeller repeat protein [Planctomycetota bacterium]
METEMIRRARMYLPIWLLAGLIVLTGFSILSAEEPYGFRVNGQGRFPDATPVTEWGPDKNVVWKTPMPGWSNASPALCGDRLFVCSEPTALVCVNLADGKILWQKPNDYLDLLTDPAEQAKARNQAKKGDEIRAQLDAKMKELNDAQAEWNKKKDDADLKKKVDDLRKAAEPIRQELSQISYALPKAQSSNGYTSATPVTDGKSVWAVFGTGVVVCYDKDGKLIWGRKLENPPHEWGSCISPLLAGNVLLVQYDNLYGLDPATGKEIWKLKTLWGWGTPVLAKIGDQYIAYTCKGAAVTVSDGKEVAKGLKGLQFNSPLLQDGILYFIEEKAIAFKLPATPADKPEKLWDAEAIHKDRYYASPLVHDGLIYAVNEGGFLSVVDAKTGQKIYEKKLEHLGGINYPSPTLAGKCILLSGENGKTIVLEPGREYKEVARNELEPFRSCPVLAGSRMYVRTLKTLYCIGK